MQTQYYGAPPGPSHSDPYNCVQGVLQPAFPNQYGAIGEGGFIGDFSRGSPFSYPHPEYAYFPDRGGPSTTILSTSLAVSSLDATGLGFTGNPSGTDLFLQPEDIAEYAQESWQWTGQPCHGLVPLAAPVNIAHVHPEPDFFEVNKSAGSLVESGVCSPTAQLPTPAAMAVLLNHKARPERRHEEGSSSTAVAPPAPLPAGDTTPQTHVHQNETVAVSPPRPVADRSDILSREKKHACTMCYKRFDRPSTLRKHLLVHTGEKAFVCETCGRRFGVASNLNRHVRRCKSKPVHMKSSGSGKSSSESPSAASPDTLLSGSPGSSSAGGTASLHAMQSISSANPAVASPTDPQRKKKRARPASPSRSTPVSCSDTPQSPSQRIEALKEAKAPNAPKRRRRAPSPSLWVPFSLRTFNLVSEELKKAAPVPLPPVCFNPPAEERNSWDENAGPTPYHPCGWRGVLPGPGLKQGMGTRGKDAKNVNLSGSGGFMLGRMMVF